MTDPRITPEQRAMHDAIARELTDQGKLIEAGFQILVASATYPEASQVQRDELRMAFFAGAQHLWASVFALLDPTTDATDVDLTRFALINAELLRWCDDVRRQAQTEGHPITEVPT